jgi:hypothetical protein
MRSTSVFSIALLLVGAALLPGSSAAAEEATAKGDPIARLVERLSASHVWRNGMYPELGLPATASTDKVIARVFELTSFEEGRAKQYRILETRLVQISEFRPGTYIAALVRTEFGDKIVLLKYERQPMRWWSRVYDSRPSG